MNNNSNPVIETNKLISSFNCPNETIKETFLTNIPESLITTSINYTVLNSLKQYLDENQTTNLFGEIISTYLIETQERLEELEKAIKSFDTKKITLISHGLKGISNTLGILKLASFCSELENLDFERFPKETNNTFEKIQQEFRQVHKILSLINFIGVCSD
jgi:HPt (histidine-containing phosphotransfer) domain-containing protein